MNSLPKTVRPVKQCINDSEMKTETDGSSLMADTLGQCVAAEMTGCHVGDGDLSADMQWCPARLGVDCHTVYVVCRIV